MTKIKICGLKREEDILMANELLPDYVGFVFAHSSRMIEPSEAVRLKGLLKPGIRAVGVFVNESQDLIREICKKGIIDLVQLHGDETADYIRELKEKIKCPVVKAVRVRSTARILEAEKTGCDYLLLDTYTKGRYGGSGIAFDRTLIPKLDKPYFLAGGLNAGNVSEAIKECRPYAVDVSSAVETDGFKDREKIAAFISEVRACLKNHCTMLHAPLCGLNTPN